MEFRLVPADYSFLGEAQQAASGRIYIHDYSGFRIGKNNRVSGILEQIPVLFFRLTERLLNLLALGQPP
jgi:hypothetical protein